MVKPLFITPDEYFCTGLVDLALATLKREKLRGPGAQKEGRTEVRPSGEVYSLN